MAPVYYVSMAHKFYYSIMRGEELQVMLQRMFPTRSGRSVGELANWIRRDQTGFDAASATASWLVDPAGRAFLLLFLFFPGVPVTGKPRRCGGTPVTQGH